MRETSKNGIRVLFGSFVLCTLAYSVMIANECTNVWDGLWCGSMDGAFDWVITIGRWFWPFIGWGRLLISSEPAASFITIALFVFSGFLILSMFSLTDSPLAYLLMLALGVNETVCIALSYRYMSPTFGTSIFLNVLGIWLLRTKNHRWTWVLATGCLVLALGSYQAYLGCALVLFLACIIQMLLKQEEKRSVSSFVLRTVAAFLLACVAYKMIWDISLSMTHLEAADYRGASHESIGSILVHLPHRIKDAYTSFFIYFSGKGFPHNAFQRSWLYPVAGLAFALLTLLPVVRHFSTDKGASIIMLVCFLCFPLAANADLLLAPEAGAPDVLMSLPMAIMAPVLLCIYYQNEIPNKFLRWTPMLLVAFFLYGSFLQCSVEQHTMLHGKESTLLFMNRVVGNLEENEMIHSENKIIFLGRPSDNPLFKKDELWERSLDRSRYGELPYANNACVKSYRGVARDGGYNLPLEEDFTVWYEIAARPESRAMPVYPEEGYCQIIDGHLVVKLSE